MNKETQPDKATARPLELNMSCAGVDRTLAHIQQNGCVVIKQKFVFEQNENTVILNEKNQAALVTFLSPEHAALVAVAEAAKAALVQVDGDLSDADFRKYVVTLLQSPVSKLEVVCQ